MKQRLLFFTLLLGFSFQTLKAQSEEKILVADTQILVNTALKFEEIIYTDLDSARYYAFKLLNLSLAHKDSTYEAYSYNSLGYIHLYRYSLDSSIYYFSKAADILTRLNDSINVSEVYMNFGNVYTEMGQYEKGIEAYQKADSLIPTDNYWHDYAKGYLYFNTAQTFLELEDLENTAKYLKNSEYYVERDSIYELSYAIKNVKAEMLFKRGDLGEARKFAQLALEQSRKYEDKLEQIASLEILAKIQLKLGQVAKAYDLQLEAIELAQEYGDPSTSASERSYMASILLEMNRLPQALRYAEKAYQYADSIQSKVLIKNTSEIYARILEANGDYKKALDIQRIHYRYRDSIAHVNISERLLRSQNKINEQQNELLATKAEFQAKVIDQNRVVMLGIGVALLLSIVLIIVMNRTIIRKRKIQKLLEEKQILLNKKREQLQATNQELEQINQGKDKLFSILTHDLKQPFNQTLAVLDILDSYNIEDEELRMLINQVKQATGDTKSTVDHLLTWSKSQFTNMKTSPENISVAEIAQRINDEFRNVLDQKNLRSCIKADPEIKVLADPNHLEIILRNLMQNAIKFSNDGGKVQIAVERKDKMVEILVRDEGTGMTEEQLRKLFDVHSHFSTPGTLNEKGTGLGMLIIHDFVKENKGQIKVESKPSHGSTFRVVLPAA